MATLIEALEKAINFAIGDSMVPSDEQKLLDELIEGLNSGRVRVVSLATIAKLANSVKNNDMTQASMTAAYSLQSQLVIDPQSGDIELKPGNF
jgi:hypothetical protein